MAKAKRSRIKVDQKKISRKRLHQFVEDYHECMIKNVIVEMVKKELKIKRGQKTVKELEQELNRSLVELTELDKLR